MLWLLCTFLVGGRSVELHPLLIILQSLPEVAAGPRLTYACVDIRPGNGRVSDLVPIIAIMLPYFHLLVNDVKFDPRVLCESDVRVKIQDKDTSVCFSFIHTHRCQSEKLAAFCRVQVDNRALIGDTALPKLFRWPIAHDIGERAPLIPRF